MYKETVTFFNYCESNDAGLWYPHVLSGVHLETDRGAIIKKYGPDSTDNAGVHIVFTENDGQRIITDAAGKELIWLPPKAWAKQTNGDLSGSITFNPANDFFWKGVWEEGDPIPDDTYAGRKGEGFFAHMNRNYDFVFLISSVNGPYGVIPHFEITGR